MYAVRPSDPMLFPGVGCSNGVEGGARCIRAGPLTLDYATACVDLCARQLMVAVYVGPGFCRLVRPTTGVLISTHPWRRNLSIKYRMTSTTTRWATALTICSPEFADALAGCLTRQAGFQRLSFSLLDQSMRASFLDTRFKRTIEIAATGNTTSILIAEGSWRGDIQKALELESKSDGS
jgi:hypothetical protein